MKIAHTRKELDALLGERKEEGPVGFVPTMGALHRGHTSLVERAAAECGTVVASIFVNPTQFNDPRDLEHYPRTPDSDIAVLEAAGADIVFMPSEREMYPEPDRRRFGFGPLEETMEGATRPGHFNGVAQVVSLLFDMVRPRRAYFGEKDFQQVAVVRSLVGQTGSGVEIVACHIVRESDGVAMSSRNRLLTEEHRAAAPAIYRALSEAAENVGTMTPAQVETAVKDAIESEALLGVIYANVVDGTTLERIDTWPAAGGTAYCCVAVEAGGIRLIDNIRLI